MLTISAAALRELEEEGGVESSMSPIFEEPDEQARTSQSPSRTTGRRKQGSRMSPSFEKQRDIELTFSGMGQLRHFFRVAVHGLEKGVVPILKPEVVSPDHVVTLMIG